MGSGIEKQLCGFEWGVELALTWSYIIFFNSFLKLKFYYSDVILGHYNASKFLVGFGLKMKINTYTGSYNYYV